MNLNDEMLREALKDKQVQLYLMAAGIELADALLRTEREECAKLCEENGQAELADAIRRRGER